ncbi:MAG TPA: hypothetical protein VF517_07275 [Thermoleophilaceae bacterium]|jgi:hypothetical protein
MTSIGDPPPDRPAAIGDEPGTAREGTDPAEKSAAYERRAAARRASFADREARRRSSFESRERRRRAGYDSCEATRQTLVATGEFYRSLGAAVADSFERFNAELEPEAVDAQGLGRSTFEAFAEGNAEFYESLADSSRRVFDELRPDPDRPVYGGRYEPIDYELLARLVADELRRSGTTT